MFKRKKEGKSKEVRDAVTKDNWTLAQAGTEQNPVILRYRGSMISIRETAGYEQLLHIVWSFRNPNEFGLPEADEQDEVSNFEDYLCRAFEHDLHGVLALVITSNGEREFFFYTSNGEECGKRINEMPQQEKPYPIEITLEEDPQWKIVRVDILGVT